MAFQANCPSCGAPLSFLPGTMVAACGYCRALAARTDRDPRLIGKVAALAETGSPLMLGLEGRDRGRAFTFAGRTQLRHPLGGLWDEWYLAFEDGSWGWLAEVQGRFYLSFRAELPLAAPPQEALTPGGTVDLGAAGLWSMAERSQATFESAEGELPWELDPGASYVYADLEGPEGAFAILDYGEEPPLLFAGRRVSLEELGLGGLAPARAPKGKALSLPCPSCGSPLDLRAPDQTERVACPSCRSLLDASGGRLAFLRSLKQPNASMAIPLGSTGTLRGRNFTCIGYLLRSCTVDGVRYPWGEYLLLGEDRCFAWLVQSEGHWSLAEAVPVSEVAAPNARAVSHKGRLLRRFSDTVAVVEGVWGEFPWKVELGERAEVTEYVEAPFSLAAERQRHGDKGEELNWSLSTYLDPGEVQQGFQLKAPLPAPGGIAPHQPNPHWETARRLGLWMLVAAAAWFALVVFAAARNRGQRLYQTSLVLAPRAPGDADPVVFSPPIQVTSPRRNLELRLRAPVDNAWVGVEGALVNEQTGVSELFEVAASYYHGVDGGESWSEGERSASVFLDALPPGTYTLRLMPQWEGPHPPVPSADLELRSGVMRWSYPVLLLFVILLVPLVPVLLALSFESRRWAESSYGKEDA